MRRRRALGRWRAPEGERAYARAYAEAMRRLPAPSQTHDIETDFGRVRVYGWGLDVSSVTPILLVPGYTSGVPMWESNLPDLLDSRPVYALDALGDCGMSVQTAPIEDERDQAMWLDQILQRLDRDRLHFVGHSFGGWATINYALHHPGRVASATLLEPVFVFQSLRPSFILKTIPFSLPFLPRRWRTSLLEEIGGVSEIDRSDPVARMIEAGSEYFVRKLPMPRRPTAEQLRGLSMPIYVAIAEKSALHDAARAVSVARKTLRHGQVRSWPDATHSLPMEFPEQVDASVLSFLDSIDDGSTSLSMNH